MRDSKRNTEIKNRLLDSVGEGEGGMVWENGIETCQLSHVKGIASSGSMHDTGCSGLVHWDYLRGMGWGRRWEGGSGWGTYVHLLWIHVNVWQNHYNLVK